MIVSVAFGSNQSPLFYSMFSVRPRDSSAISSTRCSLPLVNKPSIIKVRSRVWLSWHGVRRRLDPVQKLNCESGWVDRVQPARERKLLRHFRRRNPGGKKTCYGVLLGTLQWPSCTHQRNSPSGPMNGRNGLRSSAVIGGLRSSTKKMVRRRGTRSFTWWASLQEKSSRRWNSR